VAITRLRMDLICQHQRAYAPQQRMTFPNSGSTTLDLESGSKRIIVKMGF
jgi:hypothetical protein